MAKMQTIELDIHPTISLVRPGDKLVVAVGHRMSEQEAAERTERLEAQLHGVEVVLIEAEGLAVYRPDEAPRPRIRPSGCPYGAPPGCRCAFCSPPS